MPTAQASRSERTRELLLDATLEVVAAEGFDRTTTTRVCEVAGVSRGAQTHHYPTKNELVIAALDRMKLRAERAGHELIEQLAPERRTFDVVAIAIWEALMDDRFAFAALETLVRARTDTALHDAVVEADQAAVASVRSFAASIEHPASSADELADALEMTLHYFRGLTLQRCVHPDTDQRPLVVSWVDLISRSLSDTSSRS